MNNTLERLLRDIDSELGLDDIPIMFWLVYVMTFFLALSSVSELLRKRNTSPYTVGEHATYLILLLLCFSSGFSLAAFAASYLSGHYYNFYVVVGVFTQLICLLAASIIWRSLSGNGRIELVKRFLVHLNITTMIFLVTGRWLIRGVDAEETSADTLNIYYNGKFQYSMHAGWYDIAPVDSIVKVMLLRVNGNSDPFSSVETFLISFVAGIFLYLIVYAYIKREHSLDDLIPLIPAMLALHPYAFLPGAYVTPTNVASSLALAFIVGYLWFIESLSRAHLIVLTLLFTTSVLAHPFALSTLIFMAVCMLAKYVDRSLRSDVMIFVLTLVLWLAKVFLTATLYGIVQVYRAIVDGIIGIWERESIIATRNVGYLMSPKLALASFSASLGIIGGIAIVALYLIFRGRAGRSSRWLALSIVIFVGLTGLTSLIAALGGYSRYVFVPFASLFFLVILFYSKVRDISLILKVLIVLAAILTVLSPNFMSDQYSFPMAAKVSDRTMFDIAGSLFEKLDPGFVVKRFTDQSDMRLYLIQEGEFFRNFGGAGLIVEKLILTRVVEARSYWNFLGRGPFDAPLEGYDFSLNSVLVDARLVKVLLSWTSR